MPVPKADSRETTNYRRSPGRMQLEALHGLLQCLGLPTESRQSANGH